jgi:hypothetical protein
MQYHKCRSCGHLFQAEGANYLFISTAGTAKQLLPGKKFYGAAFEVTSCSTAQEFRKFSAIRKFIIAFENATFLSLT